MSKWYINAQKKKILCVIKMETIAIEVHLVFEILRFTFNFTILFCFFVC